MNVPHYPFVGHVKRAAMLLHFCLLCVLVGCSNFGGNKQALTGKGPSLAQVVKTLPAVSFEISESKPSPADVIAAYGRIYGEIKKPNEKHSIGKRLADLEMGRSENRDIEGEAEPYLAAIKLYESLLDSVAIEQLDLIYYQLARAHELSGNSSQTRYYLNKLLREYPDSIYRIEAHFRRAEHHFSAGEYKAAAVDYNTVIVRGQNSPYVRNALYMRGWSLFKSSSLDTALPVFFELLAQILEVGERGSRDSEILEDTLRVVVHTLTYLQGGQTLAEHMALQGNPDWQHIVYQKLAEDYRDNERYLDSVASLQTFIDNNTLNARSPVFHQQMIDTLVAADFPSEVLPKKKEFVQRYGIRSRFWNLHGGETRQQYQQALETYLFELARITHADAQSDKDPEAFIHAADWYEQIMETFPDHADFSRVLFLSGEAYTEAGRSDAAVAAYQALVWEYPESEHAIEAAYAAVLGLDQLVIDAGSSLAGSGWQDKKIAAQIEFALLFPDDLRAPGVQADAANTLFSIGRYAKAAELARNLLSFADLDREIRENVLLIVGHSSFELLAYADAEAAYRKLLPTKNLAVQERILASIYKQGELAERTGESAAAVSHYLRAHEEAPGVSLAIKGLNDAILIYESLQEWDLAAHHLNRFRTLYPRNDLSRDIPKRLVAYYEKSQRWTDAAQELLVLVEENPIENTLWELSETSSSELARVSKYRAAELFLLAEDYPKAIEHFRDYAHQYKLPKALNLEAMHHMDLLYQRTGATDKRRFWLRKKILLHAGLATTTEVSLRNRATNLAAEAQYVIAMDARNEFRQIRLKLPLKSSLKRKQKALLQSVSGFEKLSAYKVMEYSSAATFEIAELYTALSAALFDSERPGGLTALELEQYELLLEEQAYPFEEQAISLHELNLRRSWEGQYDEWVRQSFSSLGKLMPARYGKQEQKVAYVDVLF